MRFKHRPVLFIDQLSSLHVYMVLALGIQNWAGNESIGHGNKEQFHTID